MTDDLQLLAAADPAPASRWPGGPIDDAAERHLTNLVAGQFFAPAAVRPWRTYRRGMAAAAAAGIASVLVAVATGGPGVPASPTPVVVRPVAAPAPLAVDPSVPVPSLAELTMAAANQVSGDSPAAVRGSHVRAWYLAFGAEGEGFPAVELPEEQLSVPSPDGGLTVTRVPADPAHPTEVRLDADGTAPADAVEAHTRAAELAASPEDRTPPPADAAALAAHLAAVAAPAPPDAVGLLDALQRVLLRWTPGPAEHSAIAAWLAQQPGLTALGAVTDRLDRPGVAYALDVTAEGGTAEIRRTVVLDADTGAVLSIELSFLDDTGEWDVDPYAVISYVAFGVG
ncbi:hypothetical protein [Modestobacter sp. SSW1-42]|uniref:hypothetical protein n=1 Tax=Modestobacter sp. SSW1-42 TaxID=596372 RepID=UPI003987B1EE